MRATSDGRQLAFRYAVILGRDQTEVDPAAAAAIDASACFHLLQHAAKPQWSSGITTALE